VIDWESYLHPVGLLAQGQEKAATPCDTIGYPLGMLATIRRARIIAFATMPPQSHDPKLVQRTRPTSLSTRKVRKFTGGHAGL